MLVQDPHSGVAVMDDDGGVVERRGLFDGCPLGLGFVGVLRERGVEVVWLDGPEA